MKKRRARGKDVEATDTVKELVNKKPSENLSIMSSLGDRKGITGEDCRNERNCL